MDSKTFNITFLTQTQYRALALTFVRILDIIPAPTTPKYTLMHIDDLQAPKTAFFTITVSNAVRVALQPGALDPAIPAAISRSALDSARLARVSSSTQFGYMSGAQEWATGAAGMKRGGDVTWWEAASTSASDRMIYQCDPGLGSPAVPDCSQIE